jgi:hypothetical protein
MRWLPSLGIGVVSGLASALAALGAGLLATEWHHMSDREGGRGMFLVFVLIPGAFLAGLIIGTWVARSSAGGGLAAGGKAIAISLALVAASLGMAWLTADHAPTIDGQSLTLDLEVRLPHGYPVQDSLEAHEFRVGLSSSSRDRGYVDLDFTSVRRDDGFIVVSGTRELVTTGLRDVSATWGKFEDHRVPQYAPIPLAPRPTTKDTEWSRWHALNRYMDLTDVPPAEQVQVRYRVRLAGRP